MVVEDEAALCEVARRIFARNGYHVITAASGLEAIEIVRAYQGDIHLLVTDVVMPHMLGKEVTEQIQAIKPDMKVLFMSGYARGAQEAGTKRSERAGPGFAGRSSRALR